MTGFRLLALSTFALLAPAIADAQLVQGRFRGIYVCEKLPTTRDILRVPVDLEVKGDSVLFARPLFDLGTRVVGNELATGSIDANGQLHLTSQWTYLGDTSDAEYSGMLTPTGGTLSGTQIWTRPGDGQPVRRTCTIAVVPALTNPSTPSQQR
jgi:hypothetical protein